MSVTSIQWTDRTWNPVRGCSVISPGCVNCYAMKQAHRFSGAGKPYAGLTKQTSAGPQWTGRIVEDNRALYAPTRWKKPQRIFVNSMSDLFHDGVSDDFIKSVFTVMAIAKRHTFQILTKRPERMRDLVSSWRADDMYDFWYGFDDGPREVEAWPLPNVHLGISAENQPMLDARLPALKDTPAAVRFLSCEPILSGLDIAKHRPGASRLWVIVGGESGPGARACNARWVRSVVRQCQESDTPVFVKQLGSFVVDRNDAGFMGDEPHHWPEVIAAEDRVEHDLDGTRDGYQGAPVRVHLKDRKGGDMSEWPEDLRVREWPACEVSA